VSCCELKKEKITMKHWTIFLGAFLLVLALPAGANTLCGYVNSNASGAGTYYAGALETFTCPGIYIAPGYTLTNVTLSIADDAAGPAIGAGSTVVNTWTNVGGSFISLPGPWTVTSTSLDGVTFGLCATTGTGAPTGLCPEVLSVNPGTAGGATGFTTGSISLAVQLSQPTGIISGIGFVDANLSYSYTESQTGVPEPASMGLVGLAVLGLGAMVRKGRKKA
jgi:hypothetical protein